MDPCMVFLGLHTPPTSRPTYFPLGSLGYAPFRVQSTPTPLIPVPTVQWNSEVSLFRPAACVPAGWPDPCPEPSFLLHPFAVWQDRVSECFPFSHRGITVSRSQNCSGTQVPGVWGIPRLLLLSSWHIYFFFWGGNKRVNTLMPIRCR